MIASKELQGLGGWLILVGIGLVIAPVRLLVTYVPIYAPIFDNGTWDALTTVGSEAYSPMWAPLLIGEIAYNSLIFIASLYLLYLFFAKHYRFPSVYIAVVTVSLMAIPLDAWLVTIALPDQPLFDPDTAAEFVRALAGVVIWVPYMLVSKRVKATFVAQVPVQESRALAANTL